MSNSIGGTQRRHEEIQIARGLDIYDDAPPVMDRMARAALFARSVKD